MTISTNTLGSKVGRARRTPGQLWQVPVFLFGVLALAGVAASAPWRHTPQWHELDRLITKVRAGLDKGDEPDDLVRDAEDAFLRLSRAPERTPEVRFLLGSAYYRQAKDRPPLVAKDLWARASEHLEEALARWPHDERDALHYRLGYSLYQQNKQVPRALELMSVSVDRGAEQPLAAHRMLVDAYLKQKAPNLDSAVASARRVLDLTPEKDNEAAALARLQLGELLLRKGLRAEAVKELDRIGARSPRPLRIKARLLQARASEEDQQWAKAISLWQDLISDASQVDGGRARIAYAIGWCHHQQDPPDLAGATRAWEDAVRFGGPAGQAAGLRLGQLVLASPEGAGQALKHWKAALDKVHSPQDFRNPFVELAQVRSWFDQAMQKLNEGQNPEQTQTVAELYRKIAPGGEADRRFAEAAEARALQLAEKLKLMLDNVKVEEVQAQYRSAGDAWQQAAKSQADADPPLCYWRSAQCYLASKDAQAQEALQQFVASETNDLRLAEGWFMLGELYRSAGKKDHARDAYYKCIEVPNTAFANKARLLLALEEIEDKHLAKAHDILRQILVSPSSDIDRTTHEKALYQMGMLLALMENWSEARVHLDDFRRSYPENANVLMAREQLGNCCRRLGELELAKEEEARKKLNVGLPDDVKLALEESIRAHRSVRKAHLKDALKICQDLADELEVKSRTKPLPAMEQILLRRARFGMGECHLDAEEFYEALQVFQTVQAKHRKTVESFYASLRICAMAEALTNPPKQGQQLREYARTSIQLLVEDVKAMPADHEIFRMPRVWPRDQWLKWAEAEERKMQAAPKASGSIFQ